MKPNAKYPVCVFGNWLEPLYVWHVGLEFTDAVASPPVASSFDYIIVGGGTAGCPLAATLSQNYSVLLLERGNTPYGNPDIENATNFGKLISNVHGNTWFSPVQSFQSQEGVFNRRARVLGGGSAINAGFNFTVVPATIM